MKRSTPLKRTAFKPKAAPPRREATQSTYTPRPRLVAVAAAAANASTFAPQPKFTYIRDERLRDMCRAIPCQHCGATGPNAGVTWAHSNQGRHGHAKGIKASDVYVAALCHTCHSELDQGKRDKRAEKVALWQRAHERTLQTSNLLGLWPAGIPQPTDFQEHDAAPIDC